jgi:UrcA family protein
MNTFKISQSSRNWLFTATALACTLTGSGLCAATAAADEVDSVTVSYADLDLSKPAGVQILYGRIQAAARKVCSPLDDNRQLQRMQQWRDCYETAVADAVTTINRPTLTALHRSSSSRLPIG